ncbi:MAG: hypothetical protein ACR2PW_04510 [Gammaproteobacteria bacterium]
MTLLSICQDVLEEVGNFDVPDTIIGNTNDTAKQILALANREGRLLSRRADWEEMQTEHTFTTVASTETYSPPSDFRYLIDGTLWDRTNYWELRGPASPQEWQELKSGIITEGTRKWIRFRLGTLYVHPVPTTTDNLVYEYVSKNWCQSSGSVGQTKWVADDDTGVIDEELMLAGIKWRWRAAKELPYAEDYNEYESLVESAMARNGGTRVLNANGSNLGVNDAVNIPEGNFG